MGNNIEPFLNFIVLIIIYKTRRKSSYKKKEGLNKPSFISYLYFLLKLITHLNHGSLFLTSIKLMLTKIN